MMDGAFFSFLEDEQQQQAPDEDAALQVAKLKRELAEAHKELAAKQVELSKRGEADRAALEQRAEQRAAELAAAAAAPKDHRITALEQTLLQLELALAQRTEEAEEARRLYTSQKRALKNALSAAAERDAAETEAGTAGLEAATAAAEEEVDRLAQELSQHKMRSLVELQAKEREAAELRQQLAAHTEERRAAVAAAQAAAAAEAEARLAAAEAAASAQLQELQSEVNRLRSSGQGRLREEREDLADTLSAVNKQKVQLQREFDAYKDLVEQTNSQAREEQRRLVEENAALKSRIAADAARAAATGGAAGAHFAKTFASRAMDGAGGLGGALEQWLARLERQRRGLVPVLVLASLLVLVLVIALLRAAGSAQRGGGEHQQNSALCVLGIGRGCSGTAGQLRHGAGAAGGDGGGGVGGVGAVASSGGGTTGGRRRLR